MIFASALANKKICSALRSYLTEFKWQSAIAKRLVQFFTAPRHDGHIYNEAELEAFLANCSIEDEREKILKLAGGYASMHEDHQVQSVLESFNVFYNKKRLQEIIQEGQDDSEWIIKQINEIRRVNSVPIPIDRVGNLDLREVIASELGDSESIPTSFGFLQKAMPWEGYLRGQVALICAPPGVGKAQPLDSPVFTPIGVVRMGDINVGDTVSTPDGGVARVKQVHPQGSVDVYRVTFSDGTSTECSENHLWLTSTKDERDIGKNSIKPLSQIIKTLNQGKISPRSNHSIPQSQPIDFEKKELPIFPYLLGALIGDGSFRMLTPTLTSEDKELVESVSYLLPEPLTVNSNKDCDYRLAGKQNVKNPLTSSLKELGLWGHTSLEKFIPNSYLFSSIEDRIELLRGMMDTDGTCCERATNPYLSTSSRQLAEDFKFLVETLGGIAVIKPREKTCSFRVYLRLDFNPFKLKRKAELWKSRSKYPVRRYIRSVEYVGKKECQCITLNDTNNLYLTDNCIVTHNSIFLANEVVTMLEAGCKVYWLALGDMMRYDFIIRLSALITGNPLSAVSMEPHKYFTDEVKEKTQNLRMSVLPAGQIDIHNVKDYIDNYVAIDDDIDVFILDYDANLLQRGESMYLSGDEIYNVMSQISRPTGKPYRLAMIASQPKIQYWEFDELPKEAAGESSRKQAIVDVMVTLGKSSAHQNYHMGVMKAAKLRRGKEGLRSYYILRDTGKIEEIPKDDYERMRTFSSDKKRPRGSSWSGKSKKNN